MRRRWRVFVVLGFALTSVGYGRQVPQSFSYTESVAGVIRQRSVVITISNDDHQIVTVKNAPKCFSGRLRLSEPIQYVHPNVASGFLCVTEQGTVGFVSYPRNASPSRTPVKAIVQRPFFPAPRGKVMGKVKAFDSLYSVQACVDDRGNILVSNLATWTCKPFKLKAKTTQPGSLQLNLTMGDVLIDMRVTYLTGGKLQSEKFEGVG